MGNKSKRKQRTFTQLPLQALAEDTPLLCDNDHEVTAVAVTCADNSDSGDDGDSAATSVSMFNGDSVCNSAASSTAVAVEELEGLAIGGGEPVCRRDFKPPPPPPRDTTPICNATPHPQHQARSREGNIGWFFANWGQVPGKGPKRERIDIVLKKNPATVIGLCEADAITDAYLRKTAFRGTTKDENDPQLRVGDRMEQRDAPQYLTIRGNEESTLLLGVREGIGNELKLINWERKLECTYHRKSKNATSRATAYSRCLIAQVTLDISAGALGTSHVVMVNHVHNNIANATPNSEKLRAHMAWLADKIKTFKVQVIMGDYNMSMFHAVAFFRSCGIVVNVGAWCPWKDLDGQPMSDSCGILFVNLPGEYKLYRGLSDLHATDDTGLFYNSGPAGVR